LAAAIGVVDQLHVGAGPALVQRHPQRVEHEVGAHVRGELPADDAASSSSARAERPPVERW